MAQPRKAVLPTDLVGPIAVLAGLVVLNSGLGLLLSYAPMVLVRDFFYFLVPCLGAALVVGGLRIRLRPRTRLALAAVLVVLLVAFIALGDATGNLVEVLFVVFFPIWAAFVVPGPGRYRWSPSQILGVALILIPLWRSLYFSLPDLQAVITPGGVAPAIPLLGLYRTVSLKMLREILFPLAGLYLLLRIFPWTQKVPRWKEDWSAALASIRSGLRRGLPLDLGWGAGLLFLDLVFVLALQNLLTQAPTLDTGDDTQVFRNITPDLVLLLALAAGIGEELLFRGILQPFLTRSLSDLGRAAFPLAVVLQALFFGVVHAGYGNLIHVILPFGFALFMGLVFRYFGLLPCIVIHVEIDILAFAYDASRFYPWVNVAVGILLTINFIAAIAMIAWELSDLVRRRRVRNRPLAEEQALLAVSVRPPYNQ